MPRPDLRLHVLGAPVRTQKQTVGRPCGVSLHGWIGPDRIDDFFASADALVVPSRWEGFGLVVPEALRNGTPAIVSRRGALPDLVTPGRTGELMALGPGPMAELLAALRHTDLGARRGLCRTAFETRFSLAHWATRLSGLLERYAPA